jgi:hypothetical protein
MIVGDTLAQIATKGEVYHVILSKLRSFKLSSLNIWKPPLASA